MMRLLMIFLFGLMSVLPAAAQELFPIAPGADTNKVQGLGTEIGLPTEAQSSGVQPIHILRDDSGDEEPAAEEKSAEKHKASFLMSTGLEYADEGEFEDAERAYLRALEVDPESEETLMRLASLYVEMERYVDAVQIFRKQVELTPENPLAHNNLAWCYTVGPDVRNIPLALRHARESLLYAPNLPSVWNTLAEAYYVSGEYEKALRSATHALDLLKRTKNVSEEAVQDFETQILKIKRAQKAAEMFSGLDEDK